MVTTKHSFFVLKIYKIYDIIILDIFLTTFDVFDVLLHVWNLNEIIMRSIDYGYRDFYTQIMMYFDVLRSYYLQTLNHFCVIYNHKGV